MSELTSKKRNSLRDQTFGIPSLRKYPLNDRTHTLKAIQFFHHCPTEYKKELAHNINKSAKKYNISITDKSVIYDYLNEMEQIEIDNLKDIHLMEESYLLNEALAMDEADAKKYVDVAIESWKTKKKFIQNANDKTKLVNDLKNEKVTIDSYMSRGDMNSILLRAKSTANRLGRAIENGNDKKIRAISPQGTRINELRGNGTSEHLRFTGKRIGTMAAIGIGATVAGAAIGHHKGQFNSKVVRGAKTAAGAAAGFAAGSALGAGNFVREMNKQRNVSSQAADPDRPLRQHAERYANFVSNFIAEVNQIDPHNVQGNANEQEGEQ